MNVRWNKNDAHELFLKYNELSLKHKKEKISFEAQSLPYAHFSLNNENERREDS